MNKHQCKTNLCTGKKLRMLGYRTLCEYYDNEHKVFNAYKDDRVRSTMSMSDYKSPGKIFGVGIPLFSQHNPQLIPWYVRF